MASDRPRRFTLRQGLLATGAIVVVVGLGLVFFGAGADVSRTRTVTVVARVDDLPPEIGRTIKVGDPIYTDIAGAQLGKVVAVKMYNRPTTVTDSAGRLHLDADPSLYRVDVTIQGAGRLGDGFAVLQSQVVQAGRAMLLVSKTWYLSPTVISIDVR